MNIGQDAQWAVLVARTGGAAWGEMVGKVTQVVENDRLCPVKANTGGGSSEGDCELDLGRELRYH